MAEKEMTSEQREKIREFALKNLEDKVLQAGIVVASTKGEEGRGSEHGPIGYKMGLDYFVKSLATGGEKRLQELSDGQGYNASFGSMAHKAAEIYQSYIQAVNVSDIAEKIGFEVDEKYKEKPMIDLLKSEDKEEKKLGHLLLVKYSQSIVSKALSEMYAQDAKNIPEELKKGLGKKEETTK